MAADPTPSPCWQGEFSSAFHCCLGETWGVDSEVIQKCWTDGRTFETCCLQGQLLTQSEIRAWRTWNVDCGCRRAEMGSNDIFCVLKDQLLPKSTHSQCMSCTSTSERAFS
ncbi:unnamed protein product [Symbiodinium sp. CCMP2592]|nr:unnamed protein product [Symbiodinium sp. CCMP2592]